DLAGAVGNGFLVRFRGIELEIGDAGLLGGFAARGVQRVLAFLDQALGEIPVARGAQHQQPPVAAAAPRDDDTRGTDNRDGGGHGIWILPGPPAPPSPPGPPSPPMPPAPGTTIEDAC